MKRSLSWASLVLPLLPWTLASCGSPGSQALRTPLDPAGSYEGDGIRLTLEHGLGGVRAFGQSPEGPIVFTENFHRSFEGTVLHLDGRRVPATLQVDGSGRAHLEAGRSNYAMRLDTESTPPPRERLEIQGKSMGIETRLWLESFGTLVAGDGWVFGERVAVKGFTHPEGDIQGWLEAKDGSSILFRAWPEGSGYEFSLGSPDRRAPKGGR